MTEWLKRKGLSANAKRVERVWRQEGMTLPKRRRRRRIRCHTPRTLPAGQTNQVWAYDFAHDWCANGQRIKCLAVIDEYSRECLAIEVGTSIASHRVMGVLWRLIERYGAPRYLRSDNGPEFIAEAVSKWLESVGTETVFIEPGKPWQNGQAESFIGRFRDECLDHEVFLNRRDAVQLIERWRHEYNEEHLHSSLQYRTPAEAGGHARQDAVQDKQPTELRADQREAAFH